MARAVFPIFQETVKFQKGDLRRHAWRVKRRHLGDIFQYFSGQKATTVIRNCGTNFEGQKMHNF